MVRRPSPSACHRIASQALQFVDQFFDALVRGFEFTAQIRDQIDEPFGADPPLFQILFERLDGIHTPSILANPTDLGEHRFHRMDSYGHLGRARAAFASFISRLTGRSTWMWR